MFWMLTKKEKIVVLLMRVEEMREDVLMGRFFGSYKDAEAKIGRTLKKIERLGGNPKARFKIE
jgi:hypothetical protein